MAAEPTVTRAQARAFRVARHHLDRRVADAETAAVVGLQDTPPGTAAVALAARADVAPQALDSLVVVPSVRGAPMAVAAGDLAVFTAGLAPPDEEAARAVIGNAWKSLEAIGAMEALDRVSDAVRDSLRGGPLARDDFHQALRERLPGELLWWCRGCGSHHVHPSLWRATGIRGVLAIVGRDGRSAIFGAPPEAAPVGDPGALLARRFLHAYAPTRPNLLAAWAGIAPSHARALWERAGPLVQVDVEGKRAWALAEDAEALGETPGAESVRLLPNLDPPPDDSLEDAAHGSARCAAGSSFRQRRGFGQPGEGPWADSVPIQDAFRPRGRIPRHIGAFSAHMPWLPALA